MEREERINAFKNEGRTVYNMKAGSLEKLYEFFPEADKEVIKIIYEDNKRNFDKSLEQCLIVFSKESPIKNQEYDDEDNEAGVIDSEEEEEVKED